MHNDTSVMMLPYKVFWNHNGYEYYAGMLDYVTLQIINPQLK